MNKMLKNIVFIFTFIFILMLLSSISYAASFKTKVEPKEVKIGDTITITLTADNAAGMYNVKISDTSILTVSSGSLSDFLEDESATIKLKAKKAGTVTVTTSAEDMTDLDNSKNTVTGGEKYTIKVTDPNANSGGNTGGNQNTGSGSNNNVGGNTDSNNGITNNNTGGNNITNNNSGTTTEQPKTKSTNAYLSTLGVTPKEYDFSGFKKSNLNYSVTVPYEVDSLKVLYKTAHSGATVKVTGNSGFDVGSSNKITVKVTAEDGKTTKTYTIKVTKLAEVEDKPGNIIDEEIEDLHLTSLSLKGIELSPEFSKDTYAYTAKLSNTEVEEIEVNAIANKENATVEISGNTDLVVGENTINIVVKEQNSTMQTVYQITLTKEAALVTAPGEEVNFMSSLIDNIKNYVIIAVVGVVLIIAAIIILIILLRKENKKLNNEDTEEEYNVYENDENEFENNEVKYTVEEEAKKVEKKEETNETETKNEGKRTRRKEKGRHSK